MHCPRAFHQRHCSRLLKHSRVIYIIRYLLKKKKKNRCLSSIQGIHFPKYENSLLFFSFRRSIECPINRNLIRNWCIFWDRNRIEIMDQGSWLIFRRTNGRWRMIFTNGDRRWYDRGCCSSTTFKRFSITARTRFGGNSWEGKRFLGGMGDLEATSRRKQWNDNRAILRNKKLISNSFVRFGWKWLSFRNRRLKSLFAPKMYESLKCTFVVHNFRPFLSQFPLNYTDCCRPVVSLLHNASQLVRIVRISADQVTAFLLRRQRNTRVLRAVELFLFLSNWSFSLSLSSSL